MDSLTQRGQDRPTSQRLVKLRSEGVEANCEDSKVGGKVQHGAGRIDRFDRVGGKCSYSYRPVLSGKSSPLDDPIQRVKLSGVQRVQEVATSNKVFLAFFIIDALEKNAEST